MVLITSPNLLDHSMNEMATSTKFDTPTLTTEEKHKVKELAAQAPDSIKHVSPFALQMELRNNP